MLHCSTLQGGAVVRTLCPYACVPRHEPRIPTRLHAAVQALHGRSCCMDRCVAWTGTLMNCHTTMYHTPTPLLPHCALGPTLRLRSARLPSCATTSLLLRFRMERCCRVLISRLVVEHIGHACMPRHAHACSVADQAKVLRPPMTMYACKLHAQGLLLLSSTYFGLPSPACLLQLCTHNSCLPIASCMAALRRSLGPPGSLSCY